MKQSFIKKMSFLTFLLFLAFGAFAQNVGVNTLTNVSTVSPKDIVVTNEPSKDVNVLWDNTVPVETSGLIAVYWTGSDDLIELADDFDGEEGWKITSISISGFNNSGLIPTNFGVRVYENTGGQPGNLLFTDNNASGVVVDGNLEEIVLSTPYTISSTGKYWLAVYGMRTQSQDFTYRWDFYTSTTGKGLKLHLRDHSNIFGFGTNWLAIDPNLGPGVLSLNFTINGEISTVEPPIAEAGEVIATEATATTVHLSWEPEVTEGVTGFEILRKNVTETDWANADVIGAVTAAQLQFDDYSWGTATSGIYHWAIVVSYESGAPVHMVSNTLDKDMIVEVKVNVNLNSGENAAGTLVKFTSTSETDVVFEETLPASGSFTWNEFRKGTYDVMVYKAGFEVVNETDVLIEDDDNFTWLLIEKVDTPIDLYVTPTAYATWDKTIETLLPYKEGFETGVIPSGWTQERIAGTANWLFNAKGNNGTQVNATHSGSYNALFKASNRTANARLISEFLNLDNTTNPTLTFWMANPSWGGDIDQLKVLYRANANDEWTTLETYTTASETWTQRTIALPNVSGKYQIAFEAKSNYGYGMAIDDIMIYENVPPPAPPRALTQYKVYLDGTFVTNTTDMFYQFDVTNLVVNQSYIAEVMADYTTGQSGKVSYEFTYKGCAAYDAPTALAVTQPVGTKNAVLTWTNPDLADVDYLRIYRNGTLYRDNLSMDTPFATWTDPTLANGTYNYALQLVYDDGAETCMDAAVKSITIVSTGTINGTVTYQIGGDVSGATITVSNTSNTYTFTTNASGAYTGTVEAGNYSVKCELAGHISQTASATVATLGTTTVNFSLFETPVGVENVTATLQDNDMVYVSWDGSGPPPPPGGNLTRIELVANNVWGDGTGYMIWLDEDAEFYPEFPSTIFYATIPIEIFNQAEYTIPENANNTASSPCIISGSAYIDIPSGTYDYVIINPDPGAGRMWVAGSYGPDLTVADDFVFEPNKKYTFTMGRYDNYDGTEMTVEDFNFSKATDISFGRPSPVVIDNTPAMPTTDCTGISKSSEFVKNLSDEEVASIIAENNTKLNKGTRALAGYEVYRTDCYDDQTLSLLATLPATAGSFLDNGWSALDFGVYKWGVKAIYDLNASEVTFSNCLDKDMNTEVSVKVSLNTAENPEDTKVTFTNTSEPDMELVYNVTLDETGEYLFEEFRKGTYDISVVKAGYLPIDIIDEIIEEATDFVWVLEEAINSVTDLFVSPTGYATWKTSAGAPFETFYEDFDGGVMPDGWTVDSQGNAAAKTWEVKSSGGFGSGFVTANAEASGAIADEYLYSPVIPNTTSCSELYLSFIQAFRVFRDDIAEVTVFDGSNWVSVYSINNVASGTYTAPVAVEIDVAPYINDDFQLCFFYHSDWGYYWSIDDIMLSETAAKDRSIQNYKVWLDGVFVADTPNEYYQHDVTNLVEGQDYTTEVAVVYSTGMSTKESYTWTYEPCDNYPDVITYTADVVNDKDVKLTWTLPGGTPPGTGYTGYMNWNVGDDVVGRVGWDEFEGNDMWGVSRYTPADLATYGVEDGQVITKVGIGIGTQASSITNFYIRIWQGGTSPTNPGELLLEQQISNPTGFTENAVNEFDLTTPFEIDITKELWVGYRVINTAGYPMGRDGGPVVNGKGDLLYIADLGGWKTLLGDFGWNYNFIIKTWVTGGGKSMVLGGDDVAQKPTVAASANTPCASIVIASTPVEPTYLGTSVILSDIIEGADPTLASMGYPARYTAPSKGNTTAKGELFNQADMITHPGAGAGGADVSEIYPGGSTYGPNISYSANYWFADDFTLDSDSHIDEIEFYGYQTGSGTTSTMTGVYVRIYDDSPMSGGQIIWESTGNAMTSTAWTNIYRVSTGSHTNTDRPIMKVVAGIDIDLEAGTYWVSFSMTGSGNSGPWGAVRCLTDTGITGNALQDTPTGWQASVDSGDGTAKGVPFIVRGEASIAPPPEGILGVNIYRNGELIAMNAQGNEFVDEDVPYGIHEYCIHVLYENFAMSCGECLEVEVTYPCHPTFNLEGEAINNESVAHITWGEEILPISEWLYYDDGNNVDGIGGPASFIWAVKFDPSQLTDFDGTSLTKIAIYNRTSVTNELQIYQGTNAAELLHSQALTGLQMEAYQEVDLTTAVPIDVTKELWIGVYTTDGASFPAACGNYTGSPNSDLISQDGGSSWDHIYDLGLAYSWNLRGFVTNAAGKVMALTPMEKPQTEISTGTFEASGIPGYGKPFIPTEVTRTRSDVTAMSYNVYYKLQSETNYELAGNVQAQTGVTFYEFDHSGLAEGKYDYQVKVYYEFDDGYTCESDPALTPDESQDFVTVTIKGIGIDNYDAQTRIYPNPAASNVTIEAANMNRITVLTTVGQVVYDIKLNSSNEESIDVSMLKAGVYVVRIATESGVSSNRITIVR